MHHFSDNPPRGWKNKETLSFHIKVNTNIREFLDNINSYRRPTEQIK